MRFATIRTGNTLTAARIEGDRAVLVTPAVGRRNARIRIEASCEVFRESVIEESVGAF